jgi:hypothetical protein
MKAPGRRWPGACVRWPRTNNKEITVNPIGKMLFWVLSPVLVVLMAPPLLVGHVAIRLLIARMRRRSHDLPSAAPMRAGTARVMPRTWEARALTASSRS